MAILNHTEVETAWSVTKLVQRVKDRELELPPFQRAIVWKPDRKQDFITSLKNGYPFGTLLFAKDATGKFGLIDGLQRTIALQEYQDSPTQYITNEDIRKHRGLISEVLRASSLPEDQRDGLIQAIRNWIRERKDFKASYGYSAFELALHILNKFEQPHEMDAVKKLNNILTPFLEELKEESDISKVLIPVIVYTGPKENLPEIFENINSKGTSLNKYQIFAASWDKYKIRIESDEIIDAIREKYQTWVDEGLGVWNYSEDTSTKIFREREFTIFEYLFGLSKCIITGKGKDKEYSRLFKKPKDKSDPDPIGFTLCSACLGIKYKEMGEELPEELLKQLNISQRKFEEALFDSVDFVYSVLKRFIRYEFNMKYGRKKKNHRIYHNDYQIVSLISVAYRSKYDDQLNIKDSWNDARKRLERNLPYHYLYDILRKYWTGVKDFDRPYGNEISEKAWDSLLKQWFEENHVNRQEKSRGTMSDTDYLFLNYIYAHLMTIAKVDDPVTEFHFDHIIAVNVLENLIEKSNGPGVPINAITNLGLLPKKLNQNKKTLTIYEYYDKEIQKLTDPDEIEQLKAEIEEAEGLIFTQREHLEEFMNDVDETNYEDLFHVFLTERFDILTRKFYELNGIVES